MQKKLIKHIIVWLSPHEQIKMLQTLDMIRMILYLKYMKKDQRNLVNKFNLKNKLTVLGFHALSLSAGTFCSWLFGLFTASIIVV